MRWLKKIFAKDQSDKANDNLLPEAVVDLLPSGNASVLREVLLSEVPKGTVSRKQLLESAEIAGWPVRELAKLEAYFLFFSGDTALAYQKLMAENLAEGDFHLLMTGCVYCYLHDRFVEGYQLVCRYDPRGFAGFSAEDFYPNAGYLAYAGGGDILAAAKYYACLTEITPMLAVNAYMIYFSAGDFEKVDQLSTYIRQHCVNDSLAMYALSWVELARDFYPEGFRLAEHRYTMGEESGKSIDPWLMDFPRWQGESLAGKTIFVHGEQGLGDVVMMARYLPMLQEMGAKKVIVDATESLVTLLANNFPDCEFISRSKGRTGYSGFDCWVGMMSLPFFFATKNDTVPRTSGYLKVPEDQARYWSGRVSELANNKRFKVGIAWSGNPHHRYDRIRSLPFELIAPYLGSSFEAEFFSLQIAEPLEKGGLHCLAEELITMSDTAALISEMDLVITIDTSIVHLAGALAIPTWLLLPHRYEWRWGLSGEKNNWYDTVAVLRQQSHGDWQGLLKSVFSDRLPTYIAEKRPVQ